MQLALGATKLFSKFSKVMDEMVALEAGNAMLTRFDARRRNSICLCPADPQRQF